MLLVELKPRFDDRGYFTRTWCESTFAEHGIGFRVAQGNTSFSKQKGTLRGMHYQVAPAQEIKLVRCSQGAVYDVVVDLRPESPTYCRWFAAELTVDNHSMLHIPIGCAHGFQTLSDDAIVTYLVSANYSPAHERGVRYNDPVFDVRWPLPVTTISEKDRSWPDHKASSQA